ncbi:MAG: NUDIX hydrolase [Candidatus Saccharimonadales bacterium]
MPRELNEQKYCGWCGAAVEYFDKWAGRCTRCGYIKYINPNPCSNVMITKGGKVLMVQRSKEPYKGKYDLPGGFMEVADESMEAAALRELQEEIGLQQNDLGELRYFGSARPQPYEWMDSLINNISFFYAAELTGAEANIKVDASENDGYIWAGSDELASIDFAWDIDKIMLRKYFKEMA